MGRARQIPSELEKVIQKHGVGKISDVRNRLYCACLDLALEKIHHEISGKEFYEKTREISEQYHRNLQEMKVSAPIDFTRETAIQASQRKIILDVLFYERLLITDVKANPTLNYEHLVKSAFSKEEYSALVSKELSALDEIYDAFLESRVGFRGLFAASQINKMRNFGKRYYQEQAQKIYPSKASEHSQTEGFFRKPFHSKPLRK